MTHYDMPQIPQNSQKKDKLNTIDPIPSIYPSIMSPIGVKGITTSS